MTRRPAQVVEIDALADRLDSALLSDLSRGEVAALRVANLVSGAASRHLADRIVRSEAVIEHSDVDGLRVLGASHFQVVRNPELAQPYSHEARSNATRLRALAQPYASPFDSAIALLAQCWSSGCRLLTLPTEGPLSPFTIRIYDTDVGIEPHQDMLSVESPGDAVAGSLTGQFGANIFLSVAAEGGALELFETEASDYAAYDLSQGPRVLERGTLPEPLRVMPAVGDLIIFPSYRVHGVAPTVRGDARLTISFFIGITDDSSPLSVWA